MVEHKHLLPLPYKTPMKIQWGWMKREKKKNLCNNTEKRSGRAKIFLWISRKQKHMEVHWQYMKERPQSRKHWGEIGSKVGSYISHASSSVWRFREEA